MKDFILFKRVLLVSIFDEWATLAVAILNTIKPYYAILNGATARVTPTSILYL
jgi:hypothetical protein